MAEIYPLGNVGMEVCSHILFDSGSQRSNIYDKVRKRLQLKTVRKEKVMIKTFGQISDSKVKTLDVFKFKVKHKHDDKLCN